MIFSKHIYTLAIFALSFFTSTPAMAQDLLARQAPIDRRVKAVDTLVLRRIIEREMEENPNFDLYESWDNVYAHRATALPETYNIDLRDFHMPTTSRAITSNFGPRWGGQHKGIDLKVYVGDTIRAAFSGKIRMVKYQARGYGKYIVIRHNNGLETIYGHLSKQLVSENDEVRAGDVIGLGGNTGRSTGSHLHFETRLCGVAINPALLFDFRAQDVTGDFYAFNRDTYEAEGREANRLRGVIGNGGYTAEMVRGTSAGNYDAPKAENKNSDRGEPLYHKVKKGETLSAISKRRGVSVDKLCKLNRLTKKSKIKPGMIIRYS